MSEQEEREQSKGFKVTDRRSFTAEGERRADVDVPEETETREDAGARVESPSRDAEPSARGAEPSARGAGPSARGAEPPRGGQPVGDMGFLELLSLLATQASIGLGGTHPVTGEPHEDLETARAMISLIEVLQEKTKGNLTPDEERTLESVLYQLRMQFVSKAK